MAADERCSRRPGFVDGRNVTLADGEGWSLPTFDSVRGDSDCDAILAAIAEAEGPDEVARFELALTILLLTRNYCLSPDELRGLLSFAPGDPALADLQRVVHQWAVESLRRVEAARKAERPATTEANYAQPSSTWSRLLARLWT